MTTNYHPGPSFKDGRGFNTNPTSDLHYGKDYPAAAGTPIQAAADGVVHYSGDNPSGYGYTVVLRHTLQDGSTIYTLYAHMEAQGAAMGTEVKAGDVIGKVGNTTGIPDRPGEFHLHLEVVVAANMNGDIIQTNGGSQLGINGATGRTNTETYTDWPGSGVYNGWDAYWQQMMDMYQKVKGLVSGVFDSGQIDRLSELYVTSAYAAPPRRSDPLVLDLDGDGIEMTSLRKKIVSGLDIRLNRGRNCVAWEDHCA